MNREEMNELMRSSSECLSDIGLELNGVWDNSAPGYGSSYSIRFLSKSGEQFLMVTYQEKNDSMSAIVASVEEAKYASRDEYLKTSVSTESFDTFEGAFEERAKCYFHSLKESLIRSYVKRLELSV